MDSEAQIEEWDPPRRFTAKNEGGMGPGSPAMATEWTVEARAGGVCRVRVVHSWFASTDDWDKQFESVGKGWPAFFRILKGFLTHCRGKRCTQVQLMVFTAEPSEKAWADVAGPLGLAGASVGQAVKSLRDAPRFAAVVEYVAQRTGLELTVRLDQPAPGM